MLMSSAFLASLLVTRCRVCARYAQPLNNIHSSQNSSDDDDNAKFYNAAQDEHDAAVVHLHLYHELLNSEDHVDIFLNHLDTDHLFGLQYRLSPIEYAIHCIK